DVAVLEALDVRVLLGEELLHRRRLGAELTGSGVWLVALFVLGSGRGIGGVVRVELRRQGHRRGRGDGNVAHGRLVGGGGRLVPGGGFVGGGSGRRGHGRVARGGCLARSGRIGHGGRISHGG